MGYNGINEAAIIRVCIYIYTYIYIYVYYDNNGDMSWEEKNSWWCPIWNRQVGITQVSLTGSCHYNLHIYIYTYMHVYIYS